MSFALLVRLTELFAGCARTVAACTSFTALFSDCFRDKEPEHHHHHRTLHRHVVDEDITSDTISCSDDSVKRNHSSPRYGFPWTPQH